MDGLVFPPLRLLALLLLAKYLGAGNTDPSGGATSGSSPNYSLTAQGNRYRIGEAMTEIFGKTKVFPAYAVPPYSELENGRTVSI